MKRFCIVAIGWLVLSGACKVSGEECGQSQCKPITQDDVGIDWGSGELFFNGEPVGLEQLGERLQRSYSVALGAGSFPEGQNTVSANQLLAVLEMIGRAGIDPRLVRFNLLLPPKMKRNRYHHIELGRDGEIVLDGSEVAPEDLTDGRLKRIPLVIDPKSGTNPDYRQLLSVLRAIGSSAQLAGLGFARFEHVEVEAQVYRLKPDGSRDVLCAPRLSTKPGKSAMIRVVEDASGRNNYPPGTDEFHQEDLANLGIRFSAKPRIIGDDVRVSGVVVLTKMKDRVCVFQQEGIPVASYTCSKMVVPFSVVLPSGTEAAVFPVAKMDGQETLCRITARVLDQHGMSQADRERARGARH